MKQKTKGLKNNVILAPTKGYFFKIPKINSCIKTKKPIEKILRQNAFPLFKSLKLSENNANTKNGIIKDPALRRNLPLPNHHTANFLKPSPKFLIKQ